MSGGVFAFWASHRAEVALLFAQHVVIVFVSTAVAIAIGLPLGIAAARRARLATPIVAVANIVQTIPSLALFGFLLPVPLLGGVGARAAIVALILYALLPIVRTTIAGINGIDPAIREAAAGLGLTRRELLRHVELPLALPSIAAGVRVAAVVGVGTATIAAAIGAGGLGEFIYRGLSMVDATVILAGAIPAAALALTVDGVLLFVERQLTPRRRLAGRGAAAAAALVVAVVLVSAGVMAGRSRGAIVVGSKNFTEQVILGELVAQAIERQTGMTVERKLNLGGTLICDRALMAGDIDVYVEYTGTALTAVFHEPLPSGPEPGAGESPTELSDRVFVRVRDRYAATGRTVLPPLGFDNTFAILVRGRDARALGLRTIDDLARVAPQWRAGIGYEFLERADGYPGLVRAYGLRFAAAPRVMDLTLIYRALAQGQVDVIAGDATAGLIAGLDLVALEDNRHYFPPYAAAPIARAATLLEHPQVRTAIERLGGRIDARAMRAMNYAVDVERRDPAHVAREFLVTTLGSP